MNHSSDRAVLRLTSRWAGRTRTAAIRPDSGALVPSRQVTVCQASCGSACASDLAETGLCERCDARVLMGGHVHLVA
jgi:hypothetical protein